MSKTVLHIFGQMNRGGAELRTVSLMRSIAGDDIRFEFVSLSGLPGPLDEEIRSFGAKVHYCQLNALFPFRFWRLLRDHKFDAVHSHVSLVSGVILGIALLAGVEQRICHFRNTHDGSSDKFSRRLRDYVLRTLINFVATDVLAVGSGVMDIRWGPNWTKDKRCVVVYNGFDAKCLPSYQGSLFWKKHIERHDGAEVFIHVGRMVIQKNHIKVVRLFLKYYERHRSGYLVLVGREVDSIKSEILSVVDGSKIVDRVIFLGERTDVDELILHANCLIFPSLWEGVPGAVVEASMAGTPVVGSDIPGIREISSHTGGITLIRAESDDEVWVSAMETAILDDRYDTRIERQRRFRQSEFVIDRCAAKIIKIYNRKCGSS